MARQLLKALALLIPVVVFASDASPSARSVSGDFNKQSIVDTILTVFEERYVYPDIAQKISSHIKHQLESGEYDQAETLDAFCGRLTRDLRSISGDKHVAAYEASPDEYWKATGDSMTAEDIARHARMNFGFERVERLTGNVGYLKFSYFDHPDIAGPTAAAVMGALANCDAAIIDLRSNGGGKENMVKFLLSYFFREPTLLINVYDRDDEIIKQSWTHAYVPGKRMFDADVYVLISSRTASGAEAFAFDMKQYQRGTIVGETTRGMAHWVDIVEFPQHRVRVHVPYARPANPITNESWEKVGVQPDIDVPAADALATAHLKAVEGLIEKCSDESVLSELQWELTAVQAQAEPVPLTHETMTAYTGQYRDGRYAITTKEGHLYLRYAPEVDYVLLPLTADLFAFDDTEDVRLQFVRGDAGDVTGFQLVYKDGRTGNLSPRSGDL